jgi:hypothetical protein
VCFVDARGGSLSALAAGVARALGVDAVAATLVAPGAVAPEVAVVLDEVAMGAPAGVAVPFSEVDRGEREVVFLGADPPPELAGGQVWDVALFDGAGDLERLSFARIARDRIERRLEAMRSGSR